MRHSLLQWDSAESAWKHVRASWVWVAVPAKMTFFSLAEPTNIVPFTEPTLLTRLSYLFFSLCVGV